MSGGSSEDQRARQQFVADPAVMAQLELRLEDLADEHMRALVIRHEHPEFEEALQAGVREIDGPDGPMNPRLHLIMHGIVATQLWDDSPPEVWEAARARARRRRAAGRGPRSQACSAPGQGLTATQPAAGMTTGRCCGSLADR